MMNPAPSQQIELSSNGHATSTTATSLDERNSGQLAGSVVRVVVRRRRAPVRELSHGSKQRNAVGESTTAVRVSSCFAVGNGATVTSPEEALAIGVLHQAARDLRRFRSATTGIKRELYLDAYTWIVADDFSWPYSFLNVCELLRTSPEMMRAELLEDASLGWFGYWVRNGERLSTSLQASLSRLFRGSNGAHEPKTDPTTQAGLAFANIR